MYTILIVDDEDNIRKAFINAVNWNEMGFEIVGQASNGVEALDFIERHDIDLLITDIMMPIMGGIELVRAVREIKPNVQIVFLSGHDEFQYAKQAIKYNILDYILKPITTEGILEEFSRVKKLLDSKYSEILDIDTQIDSLKELQNVKKDLFLVKLICNGFQNEQISESFSEISISIPETVENSFNYVICVIKPKENCKNIGSATYKRLLNIVEIISKKYVSSECVLYGDRVITLACDTSEALNKFVDVLSKDILLTSKRILGIDIAFAQSNYYEDITQTHIAFSETNDAVISIEKTDEQIIHINDIISKKEDLGIGKLLNELEANMISADKEAVTSLLSQIFDKLQDKQANSPVFNLYVFEILSVLFKTRRIIADDIELEMMISKFFSFNAPKEKTKEEILNLGLSIIEGILNQRQKNVGYLVSRARDIVTSEYNNPELTLSLLAKKLNCSPNYLSSNIKKSLGKSFVELLVDARMNKAREQLLTTNKKIREISEECGFTNQHYFSYSFKKYFNQSPNAIRKDILSSDNE